MEGNDGSAGGQRPRRPPQRIRGRLTDRPAGSGRAREGPPVDRWPTTAEEGVAGTRLPSASSTFYDVPAFGKSGGGKTALASFSVLGRIVMPASIPPCPRPSPTRQELKGRPRAMTWRLLHRRDVASLMPEWRTLYREAGTWSPFSDPDYQLAWCEMFVPPGREKILTVRKRDRNWLVAVLPLLEASFGCTPRRGSVRSMALELFMSHICTSCRNSCSTPNTCARRSRSPSAGSSTAFSGIGSSCRCARTRRGSSLCGPPMPDSHQWWSCTKA